MNGAHFGQGFACWWCSGECFVLTWKMRRSLLTNRRIKDRNNSSRCLDRERNNMFSPTILLSLTLSSYLPWFAPPQKHYVLRTLKFPVWLSVMHFSPCISDKKVKQYTYSSPLFVQPNNSPPIMVQLKTHSLWRVFNLSGHKFLSWVQRYISIRPILFISFFQCVPLGCWLLKGCAFTSPVHLRTRTKCYNWINEWKSWSLVQVLSKAQVWRGFDSNASALIHIHDRCARYATGSTTKTRE